MTGLRQPMQQRARATRGRILDVAATLIADQGYAPIQIQDIATAAGVSRGSVYHHFRDKEQVAQAVVRESFVMEELPAVTPRLQGVVDAAALVAEATVRVPVVRAAVRLATEQTPFYGHLWDEYIPMVTRLLTASREAGELLPGVDPSVTAAFWVDGYTGRDMRCRSNYAVLPQEIAVLSMQVIRGIATPETMMQLDVTVQRGVTIFQGSRWAKTPDEAAVVTPDEAAESAPTG